MTPTYLRDSRPPFPWRRALLGLLLLLLLLGAVGVALRVRDALELARERAGFDSRGVPLVMGPLRPGGPLWGPGDLGELNITDMGWQRTMYMDGSESASKYITITVENKGARTWRNVQAVVDEYDHDGRERTERIDVGTLEPGDKKEGDLTPALAGVAGFRLEGLDGR